MHSISIPTVQIPTDQIGSYDAKLVIISIVIALLTSHTALTLARRAPLTEGVVSTLWLISGSISLGIGIWTTHFVGILAFQLPIQSHFDIPTTFLSLLIAMTTSYAALSEISRQRVSSKSVLSGGVLIGLGICAIYYTGMFSMKVQSWIHYDPLFLSLSIFIAVVGSMAALRIAFYRLDEKSIDSRTKKMGSTVLMAAAITGMHYTGMAATDLPFNYVPDPAGGTDSAWLAVTIAITASGMLLIASLLSAINNLITTQTRTLVRSLNEANEKLRYVAHHDDLTKLPNRTVLVDRISHAISSAQRTRKHFALMFIDLDRFKTINDSFGHHYGDKLLQAAALRLTAALRAEDTIVRLGGDEFVVLIQGMSEPQIAADVAQKILSEFTQPFHIEGRQQAASCSIGISIFPNDSRDVTELMMAADSAMYYAKKMGRANYRFFSPEMNDARVRVESEQGLRRALEHQEFELYYQPRMDIKSDNLIAMEALVRWRHPQKGIVGPSEFIPLAEEIGLIIPLGTWVLKEACRQNKAWQDMGLRPLQVAINLSSIQFNEKNLVDIVMATLQESHLDPRYVELEITESAIMQNASAAAWITARLRNSGIYISIDDFGTGYSNLTSLRQFAPDKIKIDRSFIQNIGTNPDDEAIVRSIIALAHSLRLGVVAEGVETREQLEFLKSLDCDEYQGFYKAGPLSAADFTQFLKQESTRFADLTSESRQAIN